VARLHAGEKQIEEVCPAVWLNDAATFGESVSFVEVYFCGCINCCVVNRYVNQGVADRSDCQAPQMILFAFVTEV
jgi:hypothetical protein